MGRFFLTFLLALLLIGVVGYYFDLFVTAPEDRTTPPSSPVASVDSLGDWLYPPAKEDRKEAFHRLPSGIDPIVIPGHLVEIDRVDVPSKVGGPILYIGDGVPEGVTQLAGIAPFMQDGYRQASVIHKGRHIIKFYKPLRRGSEVVAGQMVGEIDYAQALYSYLQHQALLARAEAELRVTEKLEALAKSRYEQDKRGGASQRELDEANLLVYRYQQEVVKAEKEVEKESIELDNAKNMLAYHQIYPKREMQRSYIKTVYRDTGEAVKDLEPILQLYSIDRLMAEAFVEIQYAQRLRLESPQNRYATIEPSVEQAPLRRFAGHRSPITGVAFAPQGSMLYVVSAGEDGYLKVWHQQAVGTLVDLAHGEPIRAMACGNAGKDTLCLAGMSDGAIHVWSLFPGGELKPKKLYDPIEAHGDTITALAFSEDGKYFASGAADGSIKLWNAQDGKLVYAFDAAAGVENPHQGAITSLHFTPQSRLVSAARDYTLRVWNLKEKGAHLEGTPIAGRSGTVHQLGVSRDGRFMLFDQGKSLQLLSLPDGRTVNTLRTPGGATPFETLAVFAPDRSLILTGGAPEGRLQLWRAPAEASRGFEVRQLVNEDRAAVTCAAFAPADALFAVSGSKDGYVYLWPVPPKDEVDNHRITNVPVRLLAHSVEAGSRQVRLGVEVQNPEGRLTPGRPVTIVFE